MPKYETIQLDIQDATDGEGLLSEILEALKNRFQKTGDALAKTMAAMQKSTSASLSSVTKLLKTVGSDQTAYKNLRRTVASFDEINRLAKKAGSTTGSKTGAAKENLETVESAGELLQKVQELGAKIRDNIIEPLQRLPQMGLEAGLQNLGNGILNLTGLFRDQYGLIHTVGGEWDNLNLKTGFWKDTITQANAATGQFNDMMIQTGHRADTTGQVLERLGMDVNGTATNFGQLGADARASWDAVNQAWAHAGGWFENMVGSPVGTVFSDLFGFINNETKTSADEAKKTFSGLGINFSTEFSAAWKKVSGAFTSGGTVSDSVQSGVLSGFKTAANSLISGINTVTALPFNGLNSILNRIQNVSLGGFKPFSFLTWRASVPKIPLLAQGAVLPANKPFLAMVGDQRHGTNVEAPLSTIQEAVVLALEDYMQGNLAGHSATVELLRQLLGAVQSISIGDDTIAAACDRHNRKMAIVNGR